MTDKPLPAYDGDEPYVFVSYSHKDDALVYPEIRWLQDQGLNVWYDEGISGASRWRDAIAGRLGSCHLLLFFVSPRSVESQVCREELEFVLDLGRPVLSVHLEPTPLPDGIKLAIANRHALFRQDLELEDYARKLLSAIATYLEQPLDESESRAPPPKSSQQISLLLAVSCLLLAVGITALATWAALRPQPPPPQSVSRFHMNLPDEVVVTPFALNPFDISGDGTRIVFVGMGNDYVEQLYKRDLDEFDATPIPGARGDFGSLYLSPDGEWVVYNDSGDGAFKKISVSGGSPVTISGTGVAPTTGGMLGLSWGRDGTIIFATSAYPGLMKVPDSGGRAEALTVPAEGTYHGHPHILPDGKAVLFSVSRDAFNFDHIAVLSLETGEQRTLIEGSHPWVTSTGHLLFFQDGSVRAGTFDAVRLAVVGDTVPVLEGVQGSLPNFRVADNGTMVSLPGYSEPSRTLVWVDLDGSETALPASADIYQQLRISPDGSQAAITTGIGGESSIWIRSLQRESAIKLASIALTPIWSPDGKQVVYTSIRDDAWNLYSRNADGTGQETRLTSSPRHHFPRYWIPDGHRLIIEECDEPALACDIGQLTLANASTELLLNTEFNERHPALSPDGRWLAYQSNASGSSAVYVRPYPDLDTGRWVISSGVAGEPLWSPDGQTLYYTEYFRSSEPGRMMAIAIQTGDGFSPGVPQAVFDLKPYQQFGGRSHALHPDGTRFLMVKRGAQFDEQYQRLILVQNWLEEVKRAVPTE